VRRGELEYLKILCWHTQGRYDNMSDQEILEIYERGIVLKPIPFDIQENEVKFILDLNDRLGGFINEEQIRAIKA